MSFWNASSTDYKPSIQRFESCLREVTIPSSEYSISIVKTNEQKKQVYMFLKQHFGDEKHPSLVISKYLKSTELILYITHENSIIACIRYRNTGIFEDETIFLIDCFCIQKEFRKKGLGSYLLASLHDITNQMGRRYSVFLKEGLMLPLSCPDPHYSSLYAYRPIHHDRVTINTVNVSKQRAYHMIDIYKQLRPNTFLLLNKTSNNQQWRLFHKGTHWVLAGFQNSFQIHPQNRGKIAWCVGLIESIGFPITLRKQAMTEMSELLHYSWVWIDARWIDHSFCNLWKADGPFHWYTYQWKSCIHPEHCYCMMGGDEE